LNKRGAFEKEGQRFTLKIYIVEEVGLNSVHVAGKHQKFNLFEVLKVSPLSQDIDNSLRQKQLDIYRADKRIREREGIEPDRKARKRSRNRTPNTGLGVTNHIGQSLFLEKKIC
jgi:hypothetical protein